MSRRAIRLRDPSTRVFQWLDKRLGLRSGIWPVIGSTSSGLVPQVTLGAISLASSRTRRSKLAPSSVRSLRQAASLRSHSSPLGAIGRPIR